jgi:heme oxygenase
MFPRLGVLRRVNAPLAESPAGLRFRLREATAAAHQRLEDRMDVMGLTGSLDSYRTLLARFLGIYQPLEEQLAGLDWSAAGFDFAARRKSHRLHRDLEVLGLSRIRIDALPLCRELPPLATRPEGLGALYVLEGATLGGQIISREVDAKLGIGEATGGAFFAGYGTASGQMWRGFIDVLEREGSTPSAARAVEESALATFACFETWMTADAG